MTESVIARVNQLGSSEPIMLTWNNRHGENIGNGPLWDAMPTSTIAETIDEDDGDVTIAEADREEQTTVLDVSNNITGVDDTQDVYDQWDEVVQDTKGGDVIDHSANLDAVPVVAESGPGGVTNNWDETPAVSPTVSTTGGEHNRCPLQTFPMEDLPESASRQAHLSQAGKARSMATR